MLHAKKLCFSTLNVEKDFEKLVSKQGGIDDWLEWLTNELSSLE